MLMRSWLDLLGADLEVRHEARNEGVGARN